MEIKELYKERRKIIDTFKKEKEKLREQLQKDLKVVDDKINGKKIYKSNNQAKTVKQVLNEVKKGKTVKPDTYKWNKVQSIKKKRAEKSGNNNGQK